VKRHRASASRILSGISDEVLGRRDAPGRRNDSAADIPQNCFAVSTEVYGFCLRCIEPIRQPNRRYITSPHVTDSVLATYRQVR